VESPTVGSVLLAAILLKFGSYGLIRYCLTLFPYASSFFRPLVLVMALISILYSSIAALSQIDMKKIIAYSSVAHMGSGSLGLFSNDILGISGSIYF
jgi:NADH-quinone oxidoreductase subunit M